MSVQAVVFALKLKLPLDWAKTTCPTNARSNAAKNSFFIGNASSQIWTHIASDNVVSSGVCVGIDQGCRTEVEH
jgi:hypothetical protein